MALSGHAKAGYRCDTALIRRARIYLSVSRLTHDVPAFIHAKIQQPRQRAEQIARPELERRLRFALRSSSLVLISAPAGYGKTVLLSRVLREEQHGPLQAWISADEDDDLQRIVCSLVTALDSGDLAWRASAEALGQLAAENPRLAADAILDALSSTEVGGVIAVDDVHRLRDEAIFRWLDRLLECLPLKWTVVLASRVDPPLALARLRAHGTLTELRAEDLRFSLDEALSLAQRHIGVVDEQVTSLWQRTFGWPVGLCLALRTGSLQHARWRADRHTFDFLASEVLDQLPEGLRCFLLRCAVLPELTAERCSKLTGDASASIHLAEIERRGLFVTVLESNEPTMRLHDLFREFLEERMHALSAEEHSSLLFRAAMSEPDPVRSISYLVRSGNLDVAEQSLLGATPELLLNGSGAQVLRLLELFPHGLRSESPILCFVAGLHAWPNFDWKPMRDAMNTAAAGFARQRLTASAQQARAFEAMALLNLGRLDEAGAILAEVRSQPASHDIAVFGELLAYWYTGAVGPASGPAEHLKRMLELLEQGARPELWYRCAPHFLFLGRPGVYEQIGRYVDRALVIAGEDHPHLRGIALALQAWLTLFDGNVDAAESRLHELLDENRWQGQSSNLRVLLAGLEGTVHALRGRRAESEKAQLALAEIDRHAASNGTWRGVYLYHFSRWALVCDDKQGIEQLAGLIACTPAEREWPFMHFARSAIDALCALHTGNPERAARLLGPLVDISDENDMFASAVTLRVTLSVALVRLGRCAEAWRLLGPALAGTRAVGQRFGFIMAGSELLGELVTSSWGNDASNEDLAALADIARLALGLNSESRKLSSSVGSRTLSDREQEVLQYVAKGESNKNIARLLSISPHTVKRHIANILDKLEVSSRSQAAAYWRSSSR